MSEQLIHLFRPYSCLLLPLYSNHLESIVQLHVQLAAIKIAFCEEKSKLNFLFPINLRRLPFDTFLHWKKKFNYDSVDWGNDMTRSWKRCLCCCFSRHRRLVTRDFSELFAVAISVAAQKNLMIRTARWVKRFHVESTESSSKRKSLIHREISVIKILFSVNSLKRVSSMERRARE